MKLATVLPLLLRRRLAEADEVVAQQKVPCKRLQGQHRADGPSVELGTGTSSVAKLDPPKGLKGPNALP